MLGISKSVERGAAPYLVGGALAAGVVAFGLSLPENGTEMGGSSAPIWPAVVIAGVAAAAYAAERWFENRRRALRFKVERISLGTAVSGLAFLILAAAALAAEGAAGVPADQRESPWVTFAVVGGFLLTAGLALLTTRREPERKGTEEEECSN